MWSHVKKPISMLPTKHKPTYESSKSKPRRVSRFFRSARAPPSPWPWRISRLSVLVVVGSMATPLERRLLRPGELSFLPPRSPCLFPSGYLKPRAACGWLERRTETLIISRVFSLFFAIPLLVVPAARFGCALFALSRN